MSLAMRKPLIVLLSILALLATGAQFIVNKPYAAFDEQPAGWASTTASDDLAGSIATFSQLSSQVFLSINDYSRVVAYASKAFMATRYDDGGNKEEASAAFFAVVHELVPNESYRSTLPKLKGNASSKIRANESITLASQDGYSKWPLEPIVFTSPLNLGPEKKLYSWAPIAINGPELERSWGELQSIVSSDCEVPPPPLQSLDQLLQSAKATEKARDTLDAHPDSDELTSLGFEYVGGPNTRTEPSQLMLQILANAAIDNKLSERETDKMLATAAMAFHEALIKAWKAKFTYLLANPLALDTDTLPLVVASTPSYPSEHITITKVAMDILSKTVSNAKPRIEMSGSLISVPTTRILPSPSALVGEVGALLILLGLVYDFDIAASEKLGSCVATSVTEGLNYE